MKKDFKQDLKTGEKEFTPSTARIEAFSDGVFAIIVTLLVLELRVPQLAHEFTNKDALTALYNLLPKFFGFALSFLVVAIFWVNHHQLFHSLRVTDRTLMWYNNLLLFWLSFVPFPTAFLGEHLTGTVPVMLYGAVLTLAGLSFNLIVRQGIKKDLFLPEIPRERIEQGAKRGSWGPIIYLLSVIAAPFSVYISLAIFVLVPIMFFIPQRIYQREM